MHLMMAGCSFCSSSSSLPGTAWGEVLAKELKWNFTNLARQGCSNGGIRIAVDEIIRQKPTFAIISPTFSNRMEIPRQGNPYDWTQPPSTGWAPPLDNHLRDGRAKQGYQEALGIQNLNLGQADYNFISETIFSLAENIPQPWRRPLPKEQENAIKSYVSYLYDADWKWQQDEWIIISALVSLISSGINFLMIPHNLWQTGDRARQRIPSMIEDRFLVLNGDLSPVSACARYPFQGEDPGYHGSPDSQIWLAKQYLPLIKQSIE